MSKSPIVKKHPNKHIAPTQGTYYEELAIGNYTEDPIVMINQWGERHVIQPSRLYGAINDGIHIYKRSHHGERTDNNNLPIEIDLIEMVIHPDMYSLNGYYLADDKLLICPESHAHMVQHPELIESYDKVHRDAVIRSCEDAPKITFTANHPSVDRSIDTVYCAILGAVIPVKCTHYPELTSKFRINLVHEGKQVTISSDNFDELITKGPLQLECEFTTIVLAETELVARTRYEQARRELVVQPQEKIREIIKAEVEEREEISRLKILKLEQTVEEKELEVRRLNEDLTEQRQINKTLMGGTNARVEMGKQELTHETLVSRKEEQVEKTQRAKIATGGEILKVLPTVAKVAAGVIVGILSMKIFAPAAGAAALFGLI